MTLLTTTLLIMRILMTLNAGDTTYNEISYSDFAYYENTYNL